MALHRRQATQFRFGRPRSPVVDPAKSVETPRVPLRELTGGEIEEFETVEPLLAGLPPFSVIQAEMDAPEVQAALRRNGLA